LLFGPLQEPQELWQVTETQFPLASMLNPELQTHEPATSEAFGLQVWQVEAVPRQVRQLIEQEEQAPTESRKNPLEHLQTPPSRKALASLHPKHWLNERPLQVVHEAWH
jgi:hypothetical protein